MPDIPAHKLAPHDVIDTDLTPVVWGRLSGEVTVRAVTRTAGYVRVEVYPGGFVIFDKDAIVAVTDPPTVTT